VVERHILERNVRIIIGVETHLVISRWGARTLIHETSYSREQVEALATVAYAPGDMGAAISSGSFPTDGMIIAPCSAKSLAAIAHGFGDNLIHRAADVVIKEHRKLVVSIREAPLSSIHLDNMLTLSRAGAVIIPPMPAFYNHPRTVDDIVDYTVARMLDQFGLEVVGAERWVGEMGVERLTLMRAVSRVRAAAPVSQRGPATRTAFATTTPVPPGISQNSSSGRSPLDQASSATIFLAR
jgi:4-hydroxy-3-polyprenylbenzoate decarboxylase